MFVGSSLIDAKADTMTECIPADGSLCLEYTNDYPPGNPWGALSVQVVDGTTTTELARYQCYPAPRMGNPYAVVTLAGTPLPPIGPLPNGVFLPVPGELGGDPLLPLLGQTAIAPCNAFVPVMEAIP